MKYFDFDLKLFGKVSQMLYKENVYGKLKERRVYNYLDNYMRAAETSLFSLDKLDQNIHGNVVWVCWLQGMENAPEITKACVDSIKRHISKKVILITADNYTDLINIPDFICQKWKNGKISNTHFSDVLRVSLLAVYGGCWIDATVYLIDEVPQCMTSSSLFCFNISKYGKEYKLGSSWWIAAKERQPIIVETRNVLYEYWKHENRLIDYFLFHKIFKKIIERKKEYQAVWRNKPYIEVGYTHILESYLNEAFDIDKLKEIKSLSPIQKLSYKMKFTDQPNTFFNYYIMGNSDYNG